MIDIEVWKRALEDAGRRFADLSRINSEKEAQQRRLLDNVRQYMRVNNNLYKTGGAGAAVEQTDASSQELQQMLMDHLSRYITHLREMSSSSIQVCNFLNISHFNEDEYITACKLSLKSYQCNIHGIAARRCCSNLMYSLFQSETRRLPFTAIPVA